MHKFLTCFGNRRRDKYDCDNIEYLQKQVVAHECCKCICHSPNFPPLCAPPKQQVSKTAQTNDKSQSTNIQSSTGRNDEQDYSPEIATTMNAVHFTEIEQNLNGQITSLTDASRTDIDTVVDYSCRNGERAYHSVSKHSPNYNMNHRKTGKAVIFNFESWHNTGIPDLQLKPRLGSEKDRDDLADTLFDLSFEVEKHNNLDHNSFWNVLNDVQSANHEDSDCLLVAVMTHGERNTIYLSDGCQVPVNLIWEHFEADKCPQLAGKPKIFIIQACRGTNYDSGTLLHTKVLPPSITSRTDVTDSAAFSYAIPNAADVLVAFSCPAGQFSWRNPQEGSWFIQAICKIFKENAYNCDIQDLFTQVAQDVALNRASITDHIHTNNKKQVPCTSSTLIRKCIFQRKFRHEVTVVEATITRSMSTLIIEDESTEANNVVESLNVN